MTDVNRHDEIQGEIIHVYDDIEEADNSLPIWWLITFYGAIAFGAAYWFYYHELGIGTLPRQQYDEQLAAAAAEQTEVTDDSLMALLQDQEALASGKEIFMTQCVACHDTQGQGREGLGPNLTDRYWVHGGAPTDIYNTIVTGVAAKGMPPWQPILGDRGVQQVTAYVLTLRNTEVAGKGPEGDLWDPNVKAAPAGDSPDSAAEAAPMGELPEGETPAGETPAGESGSGQQGTAAPDKKGAAAMGVESDPLPKEDETDGDKNARPAVKLKALPFDKDVNQDGGAQTQ